GEIAFSSRSGACLCGRPPQCGAAADAAVSLPVDAESRGTVFYLTSIKTLALRPSPRPSPPWRPSPPRGAPPVYRHRDRGIENFESNGIPASFLKIKVTHKKQANELMKMFAVASS
ncbi:Error-prone DNA polymerase, partial [Dissostichus eleginoides]